MPAVFLKTPAQNSQAAAVRFQQMAVKYEEDLGEHEDAIERLERISRISDGDVGHEEEE